VPPDNRPYYLPGNNVTRAQMSKFVDLGRRNIADAIGTQLVISSTHNRALDVSTTSSGEAISTECLTPGNNCYGVYSNVPQGDLAGYFCCGHGFFAQSSDVGYSGVDAIAIGASAYAVHAYSNYVAAYAKSTSNTTYSMYVDTADGPTQPTAGLNVRGGVRVEGNLTVLGSKSGYVVDVMQNVGTDALEPGDVVVIVGNSSPVLGQIPVVLVKKATSAYDTGVAGVVDQAMYVPDAATKVAYDKQQADMQSAVERRSEAMIRASAEGNKPDLSGIKVPDMTITDEQGTVHAIPDATRIPPNGYVNVVTLGSYKAVKVDASFGAIHAGDLLTTSPHDGYAMKVTDKAQAFGATIGKALGDLDGGTGTIPVLVTLK
jgi:hypothetical protein